MVKLAGWLLHLLTKLMEVSDHFGPGLVRVNFDVVTDAVCWPKTVHTLGYQQPAIYNILKQFLGILVKLASLFANLRIIENLRKPSA